jgi:hypothetical protein
MRWDQTRETPCYLLNPLHCSFVTCSLSEVDMARVGLCLQRIRPNCCLNTSGNRGSFCCVLGPCSHCPQQFLNNNLGGYCTIGEGAEEILGGLGNRH